MWWCAASNKQTRRIPGSSRLVGLLTMLLLALPTMDGAAQSDDDVERAADFAQRARDAFVAGDYVAALEFYDEAFALDPHPVIAYNQARCYEELGELPRALERFRAALALDPAAGVRDEVNAKIIEIEAVLVEQGYELGDLDPETFVALASLTITSLPNRAEVYMDGEALGRTPIEDLFVAAGTYTIEVRQEGFQPHVRTVHVEPGRNAAIHAGLRRATGIGDYTPPEPGFLDLTGPRREMAVFIDDEQVGRTPLSGTAVPPGRYLLRVEHEEFHPWSQNILIESGRTIRLYADSVRLVEEEEGWDAGDWGIASMVAGGAFLLTGTVFGVVAQADSNRYNDRPEADDRADARDGARRNALIADIGFITAGALLATGAVLLFVVDKDSDDDFEDSEELVRVRVGPVPRGVGVSVGGRF